MNNPTNSFLGRGTVSRRPTYTAPKRDDGFTLDLWEIALILRRSLWLIALCGFLGTAVATYLVLRITPVYVATSQILLGNNNRADDALGSLFEGVDRDNGEIFGEISIMTSGRFLTQVSESLNLSELAEFNPDLRPVAEGPGLAAQAVAWLKDTAKSVLGGEAASLPQTTTADPSGPGAGSDPIGSAANAERSVRGEQAVYVETLARRLTVRQQGYSSVLNISFASTDPMVAAAVANTVADEYIAFQLEDKLASVRRLTDGLNGRIADLRARLEESERKVIELRSSSPGGELGGGAERLDEQLAELSTRLVRVRAERAELEAETRQIAELVEQQGSAAAIGVVESDLLSQLQEERSEQQRREARLIARFGPDSSQLVDVAQKMSQIDDALDAEVARLLTTMENSVAVAAVREDSVRRQFNQLEQDYFTWSRGEIERTELERERDANRLVYESFLTTLTQNNETVALQAADARVVNYAEPPRDPVAPRKKISVALGLIAGLCAGLGLAFLRAYLDKSVDGTGRLRRLLGGVPVVATVPMARGFLRRRDPVRSIGQPGNAAILEAMRTLRSTLILGQSPSCTKIAVISARPGEGKTTTSLLLGHVAARADRSVLVVETDLRRSSMTRLLQIDAPLTLPDLLDCNQHISLRDMLAVDPRTGAHVLPANIVTDDPGGLLLSSRMSRLIERLESEFDVIIFDTPPLLSVSDAVPILHMADQIVLAVRWKKSSIDDVEDCMRRLGESGLTPYCAVLTMVGRKARENYRDDYGYGFGGSVSP